LKKKKDVAAALRLWSQQRVGREALLLGRRPLLPSLCGP